MEREKRPTTGEKILSSGFAGNLAVIGTGIILRNFDMTEEVSHSAKNMLLLTHMGFDLIQFAGFISLMIEGYSGKHNFLYPKRKK